MNNKSTMELLGLKGAKQGKIGTSSRFYADNFNFLFNIARDRYRYENTEGKNDMFDFMEKMIVKEGKVAMYDHPENGLMALRARQANGLRTIYGKPSKWILYDFLGKIITWVEMDDPRLFMVFDNPDFVPLIHVCHNYAAQLSMVDDARESNLIATKKPFLISARKQQMETIEDALKSFVNEVAVVEDEHIDLQENIKVFNLEAHLYVRELREERNSIFFDFLKQLGYTNQIIDKRERLVAQEAENGFDVLMAADIVGYQKRTELIGWLKSHKSADPVHQSVHVLPNVNVLKMNDRIYQMGENTDNKPSGDNDDFKQVKTQIGGV